MPSKSRSRSVASAAVTPASLGSRLLAVSEELTVLETAILADMEAAPHLEHNPDVVAFVGDLRTLSGTLRGIAEKADDVRNVCALSADLRRKAPAPKAASGADTDASPGAPAQPPAGAPAPSSGSPDTT